jgi:putative transcriptional regulator
VHLRNWRRWIVAAAALCLPATLLHAALPTEPDASGRTSFAGQLLIASPDLRQPIFDHAVILLAQHSRSGAVGIIINRLAEKRPIAGLLAAFGADASGVTDSVRVFVGGPVEPAAGFVLHSAEYRRAETLDIDGQVALTVAPDVLRDIGLGKGPSKSLIAFGYAGWAPAQLEGEIAHACGRWFRRTRRWCSIPNARKSGPRHWRARRAAARPAAFVRQVIAAVPRTFAPRPLAPRRVDMPGWRPTLSAFRGELPGGS